MMSSNQRKFWKQGRCFFSPNFDTQIWTNNAMQVCLFISYSGWTICQKPHKSLWKKKKGNGAAPKTPSTKQDKTSTRLYFRFIDCQHAMSKFSEVMPSSWWLMIQSNLTVEAFLAQLLTYIINNHVTKRHFLKWKWFGIKQTFHSRG